jgi:hypothetical protein
MGFTGQWAGADRYNEAKKLGVEYDAWSNCNKLCSTGCSIQNKKPQICDEFFCSFIEHDLEPEYRPKDWGFVGHIQKGDGALGILSMDKTLPPDIQYNNNKQMLDQFIEEVMVSEGKKLVVYLHTKQGVIRIR